MDTKKLAKYISSEIVAEMKMGQSNEQLDKFAIAIARAFDRYLQTDVQVKTGIQVESTMTQTEPGELPTDPPVTKIVKIKGETVTSGKLY